MSPVGNLRMVRGWGDQIGERKRVRKEQRKRARDLEKGKGVAVAGMGRQGSVCEDVEMQCGEGGGKDEGCGSGVGKKC